MDFKYNSDAGVFTIKCHDETETDEIFDMLTEYRRMSTKVFFTMTPEDNEVGECFDTLADAESAIVNTPPEYRPQGTFTVCETTLADYLTGTPQEYKEVKQLTFSTK